MVEFLETLHQMVDDPLSWSTIVAIFLLIARHRERMIRSRERSEMRYYTRKMAERMKVPEWNGNAPTCESAEVRNLKRLWSGFCAVMLRKIFSFRRRKKRMQTNWITLIPALVGALKLILQPFGIDLSHITDGQVNDVANGVAALLTIIGVLLPHKKGGTLNVSSQPTVTLDNNK